MVRFDLEMDGEMEASEDGRWIRYHDHMDALAEKDRESVKWSELVGSFTQSQHRYLVEMERLKKDYQQLMEKAVRFAQAIYDPRVIVDDPLYEEAKVFLKEREQ